MTRDVSVSIEQAVHALARRVRELKPIIETEEATKTSLIIPFITDVLGYDATDPREVIPEYTADIGKKKGEKVDYAIKSGDDFRFLIEAKTVGAPLSLDHATQLVRYFNVTDCDFAILTNGEVYHFYAQLDAANRMDEKPFMTLDLANVDARIFPHLDKCTKSQFDADTINESAEELKYVAEIKKVLKANFSEPDTEWVKQITQRVTSRRMTATVLDTFTGLVITAQSQFVRDEVNRRLRSAQDMEDPRVNDTNPAATQGDSDGPLSRPRMNLKTALSPRTKSATLGESFGPLLVRRSPPLTFTCVTLSPTVPFFTRTTTVSRLPVCTSTAGFRVLVFSTLRKRKSFSTWHRWMTFINTLIYCVRGRAHCATNKPETAPPAVTSVNTRAITEVVQKPPLNRGNALP